MKLKWLPQHKQTFVIDAGPVLAPRVLAFALALSFGVGLGADGPGDRPPLGVPRLNRIGPRPAGGKVRDFEFTGAALRVELDPGGTNETGHDLQNPFDVPFRDV